MVTVDGGSQWLFHGGFNEWHNYVIVTVESGQYLIVVMNQLFDDYW